MNCRQRSILKIIIIFLTFNLKPFEDFTLLWTAVLRFSSPSSLPSVQCHIHSRLFGTADGRKDGNKWTVTINQSHGFIRICPFGKVTIFRAEEKKNKTHSAVSCILELSWNSLESVAEWPCTYSILWKRPYFICPSFLQNNKRDFSPCSGRHTFYGHSVFQILLF